VGRDGRGSASFVLEDLTFHRAVDQLDGLGADDCLRIAGELRRLHDWWRDRPDLHDLGLRRAVPASIDPGALGAGLEALASRWRGELTSRQTSAFATLVAHRDHAVEAFAGGGPVTLCHGDPRADNVRFDTDGTPVLFDWQQVALHPGSADLAWLAATSLTPELRRQLDGPLASGYGISLEAYRRGFVLPGLAVLLLAQRATGSRRAARFVAVSLQRIGTALADLDVPGLGSP
jgi:Ser/Thr protein kinase RdoA (MazF antagonist)